MTTYEALTISSLIVVPLVSAFTSVWVNRKIAESKENTNRKIEILRALMATRATPMSPYHVEALNRIDLEFSDGRQNSKKVIDAWRDFQYQLKHTPDPSDDAGWRIWDGNSTEKRAELLYQMSHSLGYSFDKDLIKSGNYYPKGFGDIEDEQTSIRRGLAGILSHKAPFPIWIVNLPSPPSAQAEATGKNTPSL